MISQQFECVVNETEDTSDISRTDKEDPNQVTAQSVIDDLFRYKIRRTEVDIQIECVCGICCQKYNTGDHVICLPCRHVFHEYCIENWLKWVRSVCPLDRKSAIRNIYIEELITEKEKEILESHHHQSKKGENSEADDDDDDSASKDGYIIEEIPEEDEWEWCDTESEEEEATSKLSSTETGGLDDSKRSKRSAIENKRSAGGSKESQTASKNECQERVLRLQVFSDKDRERLQKSVNSIRKSLKAKNKVKRRGKCRNVQKFEAALDEVVNEICDVKIRSRKKKNKFYLPRDKVEPSNWKQKMSPAKSRQSLEDKLLARNIINKKNLTFADMLKIENRQNCDNVPNSNKGRPTFS